jgi:hypothetical protein
MGEGDRRRCALERLTVILPPFPHYKLRFYLLALLASTELSLLVAPISSPIHRAIIAIAPSRLPFQWIAFLREQWIVFSLAITQLYPLFFPATASTSSGTDDVVKTLIGIDSKDAEGIKIALERTSRLTDELEIINIRTFDKRRRLFTGAGAETDPVGRSGARMQEGEQLLKRLKREMENRPLTSRFGYLTDNAHYPQTRYKRESQSQRSVHPFG